MMEETCREKERVILFAVSLSNEEDCRQSLAELSELAQTAGADTIGMLLQNRGEIHPVTYLGSGKLEELDEFVRETKATGVICDDELSPLQFNKLSEILHVKVMDRTLVILDIFAKHASSAEGKLQVELAQLAYTQARLKGFGHAMSRLGGGIGTRGPGEKKLETDRRLINKRMAVLNRELKDVGKHREETRKKRKKNGLFVIALVGYTNAGKSSILNMLTGASVLQEDKVFATLDPTTRIWCLPDKQEVLLTDTVGFIRKLPHHLINAFRSTLEEARYADIIFHVVDASSPYMDMQMHVVYETLTELGISNKRIVTLFNKQDKIKDEIHVRDLKAEAVLKISAVKREGAEQLGQLMIRLLTEGSMLFERLVPYSEVFVIQKIRKNGRLLKEEYQAEGIYVKAYVPKELYGALV
ncbi:MAG TPA: GTPase HflX [Lachnospiraceae bacterium]|nr:GTPase HflX [Lachnospiraceae bacterium]